MENEVNPTLAIVPRPMGLTYLKDLARTLAASKYFPSTSMEQAVAKIKAGEELGIPPVAALQAIYFFDGKITLSATLMGTLIQKSGRFAYRVRLKTAQECRIEFFEGTESLGMESFTIEEARIAGLLNKDNWRKYPKAMLFNRAMSNGAKTYCPAVFAGQMVYALDELDMPANPHTGEPIDGDYEVADSLPSATADQKQALHAFFREEKMRGPDQDRWLARLDLPPISQMNAEQAGRALAWANGLENEPEPDPGPEPTEAAVPAA